MPLGVTDGHLAPLPPIIRLLIAYTFLSIDIDLALLVITGLHNSGALRLLGGGLQADDSDVLLFGLLVQHLLNGHVRRFVLEGAFSEHVKVGHLVLARLPILQLPVVNQTLVGRQARPVHPVDGLQTIFTVAKEEEKFVREDERVYGPSAVL